MRKFSVCLIVALMSAGAYAQNVRPAETAPAMQPLLDVPEVRRLEGHTGCVTALAFSPDGKLLASGGTDATLRIWEVKTGKLVRSLRGHKERISELSFSGDGKRLASTSYDATAKVWDVEKGELLADLKGHRMHVHGGGINHKGDKVVTASCDRTVRVWDVEVEKELFALDAGTQSHVAGWVTDQLVAFEALTEDPNAAEATVALADCEKKERVKTLPAVIKHLRGIGPGPKENQFWVSNFNATQLFDTEGKVSRKLLSKGYSRQAMRYVGETLMAVNKDGKQARLVEVPAKGEREIGFWRFPGDIGAAAISPDGQFVAYGGGEKFTQQVDEWKPGNDLRIRLVYVPRWRHPEQLLYSPTSQQVQVQFDGMGKLCVMFYKNELLIIDLPKKQVLRTIEFPKGRKDPVCSWGAVSQDGRYVLPTMGTGMHSEIAVYEVATGEKKGTLKINQGTLLGMLGEQVVFQNELEVKFYSLSGEMQSSFKVEREKGQIGVGRDGKTLYQAGRNVWKVDPANGKTTLHLKTVFPREMWPDEPFRWSYDFAMASFTRPVGDPLIDGQRYQHTVFDPKTGKVVAQVGEGTEYFYDNFNLDAWIAQQQKRPEVPDTDMLWPWVDPTRSYAVMTSGTTVRRVVDLKTGK